MNASNNPQSKTILIAEATPHGGGDLTFTVNEHAFPEQLAQVAAYALGEMVGRCEDPRQAFELMAKITQGPADTIDSTAIELPDLAGDVALTHSYSGPGVREDNGETEEIRGAFALAALHADGAVLDNGEGGRWSIDRDALPNLTAAVAGSTS